MERTNLIKREEALRNAVHGIKVTQEEKPQTVQIAKEEEKVYI